MTGVQTCALPISYMTLRDGESAVFDFDMTPRFVDARPEVLFSADKCAVMRGPVVYCSESVDNGEYLRNIRLDRRGIIDVSDSSEYGMPTLSVDGYRRQMPEDAPLYSEGLVTYKPIKVKMIPYYAFANRGENEMLVWHNIKI